MTVDFVLYEEELTLLTESLRKLRQESSSRAVFLIGKNGQQIAAAGEVEQFDAASLISLTASGITADDLTKLISNREFSRLLREGEKDHVSFSIVAKEAILITVFDDRSSLGLVRLRTNRSSGELVKIFDTIKQRAVDSTDATVLAEITDDDIKELFTA
ncbi:roadblock/LC7 domain-containing protein [Streptomyces sp. SID4931]|nr:roadblock/LC7 domain-containing protein [Streptomyces sp. SID4931]SCF74555.1 hypothetical protein GA0115255_105012 [Streptomyces sp. Ncost-T6T-2b]